LAKAIFLENYFLSVLTNEDASIIKGDLLPCVDPIQIHVEGVAQLCKINSNKANSQDNLTAHFLTEVSFEIEPA